MQHWLLAVIIIFGLSRVQGFFDPDRALLNASEHGCVDGIKDALNRGAHMGTRNNFAISPIIFAANNGHLDAVRYLLDIDAQIEDVSNNGRTPLMWACYWGHVAVVKYLVSRGANINVVDYGTSITTVSPPENYAPLLFISDNHTTKLSQSALTLLFLD